MNDLRSRLDAPNYYRATQKYDLSFPQLTEDLDVDTVVIGGGFSGINTALELAEKGLTDIVVLEARMLGYGGTGRNGGQVMAGIGHDLNAVSKHVGKDGMEMLFQIANLGAGILRGRAEKYGIDADVQRGYGYLSYNKRQTATLRNWLEEFRAVEPDEDIELLEGQAVHQILGSDVYHSALKHMGGGQVHSLNLLLGEAKALVGHGARIFENSPVLSVEYGDRVLVRTATGSVRASKLLWACDSFLQKLEPEIYDRTINTYSFQISTAPLSDALIQRISAIRGAFSDISPVINYFRVTNENRLLFGSATRYLEYIPSDFAGWNRALMAQVFPYLKDVPIEFAWGGPMACSANLFPQIGTLKDRPNAFYVQGYSGFGVTPSHIVCKVLAEGMSEGSARYDLMSSIPHARILGRDSLRVPLLTAAKSWQQLAGFFNGRR
ncbi:FAD dependent oxidoreductase [Sphingobium chlorophenolicum L-1]|uniref:FAD dependent oxidoreductase n=1 Tax=Sphingobium chlorophenolicum L-1 TaxID=690566 RepID=F6EWX1_SPHCR|nr:FAD-binding oxidoreductase [Sphingobium chlorophenolicum]AEG48134.1 FAD dependent oxidoreductase [Sphingobium chlorophenolicum L-1]